MKKLLLLIMAILPMCSNVYAEGLTATLQKGDQMTAYYGLDALKSAYAAADSGSVITLSPGAFNTLTSITKSVKIIGTYGFSSTTSQATVLTSLTVSANNVTLEGIYFSGTVTLGGVNDCLIKRCWIETKLTSTANHYRTKIDQCVVKVDEAVANGYNYSIYNSTIEYFNKANTTSNKAYIANCFIYHWAVGQTNTTTTYSEPPYRPYATYINNVLGCKRANSNYGFNLRNHVDSEFYNNVFYGHYGTTANSKTFNVSYPEGCVNRGNTTKNMTTGITYTYPNTTADWGTGIDDTPIGVTGGQGFVAYPRIPRITSSTIDKHTNAEGKINVKVNVAVPQ